LTPAAGSAAVAAPVMPWHSVPAVLPSVKTVKTVLPMAEACVQLVIPFLLVLPTAEACVRPATPLRMVKTVPPTAAAPRTAASCIPAELASLTRMDVHKAA